MLFSVCMKYSGTHYSRERCLRNFPVPKHFLWSLLFLSVSSRNNKIKKCLPENAISELKVCPPPAKIYTKPLPQHEIPEKTHKKRLEVRLFDRIKHFCMVSTNGICRILLQNVFIEWTSAISAAIMA